MALFGKKKTAAAPDASVSDDPFGAGAVAPQATPAAPIEPPKPRIKVRADVYTLLLGLSALAMTIACVLFYLSVARYDSNPVSGIPRAMITLFGG